MIMIDSQNAYGDNGYSIFDETTGNPDDTDLAYGSPDNRELTSDSLETSDLISGIPSELSSEYLEQSFCDICQCINETATLLFVDCNYAGHPVGLGKYKLVTTANLQF